MERKIDTDAVINSIRLAEQAGDVVAIDAGYWHLYAKAGGLYHEDDNEVVAGPLGTGFIPGGRLTLTTATPVTTADVNNATTVYYTPYIHNMIELYDGARWIPVPFSEVSIAVGAYTASKPYDIWGYLSSGTVALESTVWTDGTTRATALAYQDGRYVKSGTTTRRYLGTVYIDSDQKTDDALLKRFVWNYYNRVNRSMFVTDTTQHTYNSTTARPWNNNTALRVEYVCGVLEDTMQWAINGASDPTGQDTIVAIAFDVTNSVITGDRMWHRGDGNYTATFVYTGMGWPKKITAQLAEGYHFLQAVESAANTTTFVEVALAADILG